LDQAHHQQPIGTSARSSVASANHDRFAHNFDDHCGSHDVNHHVNNHYHHDIYNDYHHTVPWQHVGYWGDQCGWYLKSGW
jgi:hypothetical protein